ncbi:hypothetical protein [Streptomyces sp. NPDC006012]|uniref:hypothetical protein n=1 Tax=Streptomyces sp. NPDC006012 TaxID=3364739 RepID=UPI0036C70D90
MVTSTHETSHRIFQDHPEVLSQIFEALGLPPPVKANVEALTPDTTEIKPLERRVDTVLKIEPSDGDSFLIAVEAQTKKAPDKGVNWAYYVSHLHAKYQLPVLLVAVCRVLEVGLENTPARELWREPEKMVVTFFPGRGTVFEEAYLDGQAKGHAAGMAEGVLRILEVRGLTVSDDVRERISACTDLARLGDWLDRSGTVEHAQELFDGDPRGTQSQESTAAKEGQESPESRPETPVSE